HVASDSLIALAYLLIPWSILNFVRKRHDIPFGWIAWLFGAFIVACGLTHVMDVWTLWDPVYWYSGVMKAFTAAVSLGTAWALYRLMPQAIALPSAAQLRTINASLEREIASRRRAELALTQAKSDLERLLGTTTAHAQQTSAVLDRFFEAAPLGLAVLDDSLRFVRINAALPQATGRPFADYVGTRFDQLPHMPERAIEAIREVAATRTARTELDIEGKASDHSTRFWRASFFPIELPNGNCLFGCSIQDISYQRQVERQREEALKSAEHASQAKDQFLAKVSHELRSPLQIAMSSAEVLKRLPELSAHARKFVDRLGHAISTQARMINDLLDLSRILSGKLHIEKETVDPTLPLLRIIDHWVAAAQARRISIDTRSLHEGQALVRADPTRLEQVYGNLLENAIKFSNEGGRVEVGTYTGPSHWTFFIRDAGCGMSKDDVQRVFEAFAQGSAQPSSGKGLGLGLAIARSLVDAFGGRVWAESAGLGQGATFFVELPLIAQSGTPPSQPGELETAPPLDRLRILYVEDQIEVAVAMQEGLTRYGAKVEVATGYAQAVDKLTTMDLDVLITDLHLGKGSSGQDVAQALRLMPRHSAVHVIAVSAFGAKEDLESTRAAGFTEHLVKPVDAAAVARAVRRAIG
ncbi:MAG TPA: ATP-binding protein, partial [Ramlibacter sp.]|nr:ATP-binding protein [Ramlibacter sp.]